MCALWPMFPDVETFTVVGQRCTRCGTVRMVEDDGPEALWLVCKSCGEQMRHGARASALSRYRDGRRRAREAVSAA